jgi:hypothetical protein
MMLIRLEYSARLQPNSYHICQGSSQKNLLPRKLAIGAQFIDQWEGKIGGAGQIIWQTAIRMSLSCRQRAGWLYSTSS